MATRNKIFQPNEIYFLTFTILDWRHIFTTDKYANLVYKWFDYMKDHYGNRIYGYVIMPNHIHVLLKVTHHSPPVSKLIQNAKRFLAYQIVDYLQEERDSLQSLDRRLQRGRSADVEPQISPRSRELLAHFQHKARTGYRAKHKVFKENYDSLIIQSRKFFLEKLNYIHKNPCAEKWRLAENPEDYKHSSAANYILGSGVYPVEVMEI